MVFALIETSNYDGRPIHLFEFTRGALVLRYAAADRNVTYDSNLYTAKPISCGPIRRTGDAQADELTVTVPSSIQVVTDFNLVPPVDRVQLVIRRWHYGDTDSAVRWVGFVDRVRRVDVAKTDILCKNLTATFRRGGARLTWQRQCPHMIYDPQCRVNKYAYRVDAWVEAKNGLAITAAGLAAAGAGRLQGGWLEWTTASGFTAWRAISAHGTNYAEILGGTDGLEVGQQVYAFPGCPRTSEGCNDLFNNLPNFGGIRHLPSKSPFDGNPVF